jgi:hypothetical protein
MPLFELNNEFQTSIASIRHICYVLINTKFILHFFSEIIQHFLKKYNSLFFIRWNEGLQTIADLGFLISEIKQNPSVFLQKIVDYNSQIQPPISEMDGYYIPSYTTTSLSIILIKAKTTIQKFLCTVFFPLFHIVVDDGLHNTSFID